MKTELSQQVVEALAFAAFSLHYNATRQQGWSSAEDHWKKQPIAQRLWCGIVRGIVENLDTARGLTQGKVLLPGLGGGPVGPTSPIPGSYRKSPDEPLKLPESPDGRDPIFPDDPQPDPSDKEAYRLWKTRNFGRIYGSTYRNSNMQHANQSMTAEKTISAIDVADNEVRAIQPGLAIDRACDDAEAGPDEVLDQVLRTHQEGEEID